MTFKPASTSLLLAGLAAGVLFACGGGSAPAKDPAAPVASASATATAAPSTTATATATATATTTAATDVPALTLPLPKNSEFVAELKAMGLDPAALPPLDKLNATQSRKVMVHFTKSLGIDCKGCHAKSFEVKTPMMLVATKMWDRWVRTMTKENQPLYCDSCHQGKAEYLGKPDHKAMAAWMQKAFVDGIGRRDGKPQNCATCHGDPPVGEFLADWKK